MKHINLRTKSLKINSIFNALYQILALLVPLITTPYISRIFNASILGDYNYYYSILGIFTLVAGYGFTDYGTKMIAEYREEKDKKSIIFWNIFFSKFLISFVCLCAYLAISLSIFSSNKTVLYIFLSMSLYIISIMIDPAFYFQGEENFVSISLRNSLMRIFSTILIFIFIKSENNIILYALFLAGGNLFASLITFFSFKKGEINKPNFKSLHLFKTIKPASSFFVPTLAVSLFTYLNPLLLGLLNSDSSQSGYFSQAFKIVTILASIGSSLSVIMLSRMSYLFHTKNEKEIEKKTKQTFEAFWIVSIPLLFGIISVASRLVPAFFGEGYDEVIPIIYISSPIIILSPLNSLLGSIYYRPRNKIRIQTIILFCASITNVITCLILVKSFGARGAAIGRLVAELIQLPCLLYYAQSKIKLNMVFKTIIKPLGSALIMTVCVLLINKVISNYISRNLYVLIIEIVVGVIVYGTMEIIFKDHFVIEMLQSIKKFFKRRKKEA